MVHQYRIRLLMLGFLFFTLSALAQTDKKPAPESKDDSVQYSEPGRLKLGDFYLGAGYTRFSRPHPLYFWPGYYDPGFLGGWYGYPFGYYSPYLYSGLYNNFNRGPNMGEVRLKTNVEDAQVFLDGALAGDAKNLKDFWLEPGAYTLKVEAEKHEPYALRIYVLSGKILKIDARLAPREEAPKP